MYSIEFLFRECNIRHKILHLVLNEPIPLQDIITSEIIILEINEREEIERQILTSLNQGHNTNHGIFKISVSDKDGNPLNPQIINLNLKNIKEVWSR